MICFHYFIFFGFFNCQILQLNAFDEEHNDIFAELWQKNEEIGTESGKCEETLQNSNENFQKIGKIKKEIVVKDEPNDYDKFDQFSNEKQQKIALNKTVKEENGEKRVKSEFIEFDRISNKEEFDDNEKDGEKQSTDSYTIFDNFPAKTKYTDAEKVELLKKLYKIKKENPQLRKDEIAQILNIRISTLYFWESKFKGLLKPDVFKMYSEFEKQKIIAEFAKLQNKFKTRARGRSYDMKKVNEKIAQKLGVTCRTIYNWKRQFGVSKKRKNYTDAEKVELLKKLYKIKKENPQLRKDEIVQMLNIRISTLYFWESKFKGLLKPGVYSEIEKQEKIAEFDHLKQKFKTRAKGVSYNMKKIEEKIAQKLGISRRTIYNWKSQFGVAMDNGGPIDNVQRPDGSEGSTSSANALNDIAWKWNDFRKKRNERIGKIRFKC